MRCDTLAAGKVALCHKYAQSPQVLQSIDIVGGVGHWDAATLTGTFSSRYRTTGVDPGLNSIVLMSDPGGGTGFPDRVCSLNRMSAAPPFATMANATASAAANAASCPM